VSTTIRREELIADRHRLAAVPRSRRPRRLRRTLCLVLAVAAFAVAACNAQSSLVIPGTGPLVTVTSRGGECFAPPCESSVTLNADGHVHVAAKPPNEIGTVPADVMTTLTAVISRTDFAALRSHPFTGSCPVAVDGQELVFEFAVGGGTQRIASCEVDIDWGSPLFVALAAALAQWVPLPVT
jgi:hypothetical protein